MLVTMAFSVPAACVGVAVAAAVVVDVWLRAMRVEGVAFKTTARAEGRDRSQQQQHSIN